MKQLFSVAVLCIALTLSIKGQTDEGSVSFSYDASGNMLTREVIYYPGETKSAQASNREVPEQLSEEIGTDSDDFLVYPNPVMESLSVRLSPEVLEFAPKHLLLYDTGGRLLLRLDDLKELNHLSVSGLSEGTYILRLIYGSEQREWIVIKVPQ